jgi:hypothetical protein
LLQDASVLEWGRSIVSVVILIPMLVLSESKDSREKYLASIMLLVILNPAMRDEESRF